MKESDGIEQAAEWVEGRNVVGRLPKSGCGERQIYEIDGSMHSL